MTRLLINSVGTIDLVIAALVILFFCGSSLLFGGTLFFSILGAIAIIVEMTLIGFCIEVIIEALKNKKGIGTITGFITNGPEALCLIVGLAVGDILFAASTPLGSNFMNPLLILVAALLTGSVMALMKCSPLYSMLAISSTALLAGGFYALPQSLYPWWLAVALVATIALFVFRPTETVPDQPEDVHKDAGKWLLPAIILLIGAGYLLDPIVDFTAEHSKTPKGVIGFFVLATLTSWPEFKSCLSLLGRNSVTAAMLNITVSNITNIWLAVSGLFVYLLLR
jgi:cation:H+ antiporter